MKPTTLFLLISLFFYACEKEEDEPQIIIKENNERATLNFDPPSAFYYGTEPPDSIEIEIRNGIPPYIINGAYINGGFYHYASQIIGNKLIIRPNKNSQPNLKEFYGYINIEDNAGNKNSFNYTIGTLRNQYNSIVNFNIDGSGRFTFSETNLNLQNSYWNEFRDQLTLTVLNDAVRLHFRIDNISAIGSFVPDDFDFKYYGTDPSSFFEYDLIPKNQNIIITEITKKTIKGSMDLKLVPNGTPPGTSDDLSLKANFEIKR